MWACVLQDCEFRYKLPYKRTSLCRVIIFPLAGQRRSLTSAVSLALHASFAAVGICSHHGSRLVTVLFLPLWICSGFSFPRRNHSVETRGRSAVWRKSESIRTVQFQDFCKFAHAACCKRKLFFNYFNLVLSSSQLFCNIQFCVETSTAQLSTLAAVLIWQSVFAPYQNHSTGKITRTRSQL